MVEASEWASWTLVWAAAAPAWSGASRSPTQPAVELGPRPSDLRRRSAAAPGGDTPPTGW